MLFSHAGISIEQLSKMTHMKQKVAAFKLQIYIIPINPIKRTLSFIVTTVEKEHLAI